jgi:hypothetical protein
MLTDKTLARAWLGLLSAGHWLLWRVGCVLGRPTFQRLFLGDLPPRPKRPARDIVIALSCFCICAALFGRMVEVGIQRGMDGKMYEAAEDAAHALAIAISDMRFGLHRGYVGYRAIFDTLERGGITARRDLIEALGTTYPNQLADRALLNRALQSAWNTRVPADVGFADRSMLSMDAADLGLVDYYKLAFRLFGVRVESAFYLYFTLLGISIAAFILAHWRSRSALAVPVLFLVAGNAVLGMEIFDHVNVHTVSNPRFLSTVGLLPGLHFVALMLEQRRATVFQIGLACLQAVIFEFSLSARASLIWLVLLIAVIAAFQVAIIFALRTADADRMPARTMAQSVESTASRLWPALVLIVGVFAYQTALSAKMHPSYRLADFLPHHLRYHNAFIGLSVAPDWDERFGARYYHATNDQLGFLAAGLYLFNNYDVPESYFESNLSGRHKMALDDQMIRKAYLRFIWQHPLFTIRAHYFKLAGVIDLLKRHVEESLSMRMITLLACGGAVIAFTLFGPLAWWDAADNEAEGGALRLAVLSSMTALFSWIPYVYAYPHPDIMGDAYWIALLTLLILSSTVPAIVIGGLRRQARRLKWIR